MRILFVSTSTTLGGAEKTVYSLATLLDPKRFKTVSVVSLKPFGAYADRLSALGVPATTLGMQGRPSLKQVRELTRIIDHQKPDVVHAVMYQAIQLCRLAKSLTTHRFKLVSSPRVNYRSRSALTLLIDRALKGRDDLLIAECDASRDFLVKKLGYAPAKVKRIYNGIDVVGWRASTSARQQKRIELRLEPHELLIGSVGRLDAQKGHYVLLEALARLRRRTPARCVIIGEGVKRAALEAQIRRLSLEKAVLLPGESTDIASWLSSFDAFALPSLWEGLPNTLLEAMALGLPVVASAVDGIPEAVTDNETGLLVAPRQPEALARRLADLAANPDLRSRLGRQARAAVFERFSLTRMIGEYESAYLNIVNVGVNPGR